MLLETFLLSHESSGHCQQDCGLSSKLNRYESGSDMRLRRCRQPSNKKGGGVERISGINMFLEKLKSGGKLSTTKKDGRGN